MKRWLTIYIATFIALLPLLIFRMEIALTSTLMYGTGINVIISIQERGAKL